MRYQADGPAARALLAGVELGGTKCVATLAHSPDAMLDQVTLPTLAPDETLPALAAVLAGWRERHGLAAVGIASFGPVCLDRASPRYGHVLATNKPGWRDADVLGTVAAPLGLPTGFDTDVNGAALAEMRWGAGRGLDDFAYVTVGTGVGVGLVVHGRPTRGLGHSEIGHIRVPRARGDDAPSACRYHDDCVEGLASGSALRLRLGDRDVATVGPDDPVWEPIVDVLAAMCHALVGSTGPLRIAIGGGMPVKQPHLLPRIAARLEASLAGYMELPEDGYIVPPALGDRAGPLGAIALAADALEEAADVAARIEAEAML
ncbi:ROK family protein [Sphingomonas sp. BK345]|uniref:ROK family protein n=1 Tax=Sphingomonas sp. BK345 TaxID=2586980 RepID=UPI001610EEF1|nr:ROK family protein [Sphingomonas sp. BK345]MBB3475500.1 fructokinase [Sphingomonas sp. BK345]